MHRFNYLCSIILVITLPLMIVILSSNLILRVSATYVFHFNDSQVISEVPYNIEGTEFADAIASYWSSFDDEPFQIYEDNGLFQDKVFDEDEQAVMKKAKHVLNIELAVGAACLLLSAGIYLYLLKSGFGAALRNRYKICVGVTIGLFIMQLICWFRKGFRVWLYNYFIGISLHKDSVLALILGDPAFKTYMLFATIFGAGILAILSYIHYSVTRPNNMFY